MNTDAQPATDPAALDPAVQQMLNELRDIHGAAEPGWWPPAPGWWALAALALLVVFLAARWAVRRWRQHRRRQRYLAALARIEHTIDPAERPREFLAEVNRLLRAVALRAFPRAEVARLQGDEWVEFVRSQLPQPVPAGLDAELNSLAAGPWQPQPVFDAEALRAAARSWVRRHG